MEAHELAQVASALRSANRELRSIRLRPADANTPVPNSTFDLSTVADLFEAIADITVTLDTLDQALTPPEAAPSALPEAAPSALPDVFPFTIPETPPHG